MVKKITKGLLNVFFFSICTVFVAMIVLNFMGIHPFIVQSGSMEPTIQTGSVAFVDQRYDFEKLVEGDVIAFETRPGVLVTHRIINIENGLIETKGDNNEVSDGFSTSAENFKGLTRFSIPGLGFLFAWIQTKQGIILSATIVIMGIVLDYALSDDKKEQKGSRDKEVTGSGEVNS